MFNVDTAVVLAGGKGTRLKPFTTNFPKPLVPLDETPILEIVLRQLKYFGIKRVVLTVNHLADLIKSYFGSGESLGIQIEYSMEQKPLGTAGPLALVNNLPEKFLVLNADVLTDLNFSDLSQFHFTVESDITLCYYNKMEKIDLGVVEIKDGLFKSYIEKPTYHFSVSMGIYLLNRKVINLIPLNEKFDMPDLIIKSDLEKMKVSCFEHSGVWLDIGRVSDFEEANDYFTLNKKKFLYE